MTQADLLPAARQGQRKPSASHPRVQFVRRKEDDRMVTAVIIDDEDCGAFRMRSPSNSSEFYYIQLTKGLEEKFPSLRGVRIKTIADCKRQIVGLVSCLPRK